MVKKLLIKIRSRKDKREVIFTGHKEHTEDVTKMIIYFNSYFY